MHTAHTPTIKFFCLKVLEDWVSLFWNKLSIDDHIQIRKRILDLLLVIEQFSEKAIRTKISKLITEIAKRQYPQHWPTFIEDIVKCWQEGSYFKSEVCYIYIYYFINI